MTHVVVAPDGWKSPPMEYDQADSVRRVLDQCYSGPHRVLTEAQAASERLTDWLDVKAAQLWR